MTIIIKPTNNCNLNCRYCYSNEETKSGNNLDVDFTKNVLLQIKDYYLKNKKHRLKIIWHGGEPLVWGINNYKEILSFMKKKFSGYNYKNTMHTNLTLINDEYIDLFLQYNVQLGFSLDGTKEINDLQRIKHNGEGTFDIIMEKYHLCKEKKMNIGCIIVATKKHIEKINELYQFLCENNISFKLNPVFATGEAKKNTNEFVLTPEEYALISIELFDLLFYDKKNSVKDSNFVEIASSLITGKTSGCMFEKNCQANFLALSPNGDLFPCGRFCDINSVNYSYGNLHKESLNEILPRINSSDIYNRYNYIKNSDCKDCEFFNICQGGCLHDGYIASGDFKTKTYLCSAYKKIFSHIKKRLKEANMIK